MALKKLAEAIMGTEINFDEWKELAEKDPAEFERKRKNVIEKFIARVPPEKQQELRELQVIIDAERQLAESPLEACRKITRMMLEQVSKEGGLLDFQEDADKILADLKELKNNVTQMRMAAEDFNVEIKKSNESHE
jgi:hypothetical protein